MSSTRPGETASRSSDRKGSELPIFAESHFEGVHHESRNACKLSLESSAFVGVIFLTQPDIFHQPLRFEIQVACHPVVRFDFGKGWDIHFT